MWKFWSLTLPSLPDAHASVGLIAVTPVRPLRSTLVREHAFLTVVPSRQGARTTLHLFPFQWAMKFAVGLGSKTLPTTQTSSGDVADTASGSRRQLLALGSHALFCVGKATVCQFVPSKCSKSRLKKSCDDSVKPTAHRSSGPDPPMAFRSPVDPAGMLAPWAMAHASPSQCSISGSLSWLPPPVTPSAVFPTAQALPELSSSTSARLACVPAGLGALTRVKPDPSQCSTSGLARALAFMNVPTAHPSVALVTDTPENELSVTWCIWGLTLGTTCQIPPVAAPALPAAAATSKLAATPKPSNREITAVSFESRSGTIGPGTAGTAPAGYQFTAIAVMNMTGLDSDHVRW
jgi:hypothetical protein